MSRSKTQIVKEWLEELNLEKYIDSFIDNGYDEIDVCKEIGLADLEAIGVHTKEDQDKLLSAVSVLREETRAGVYLTLEERCQQYPDTFRPTYQQGDQPFDITRVPLYEHIYGGKAYLSPSQPLPQSPSTPMSMGSPSSGPGLHGVHVNSRTLGEEKFGNKSVKNDSEKKGSTFSRFFRNIGNKFSNKKTYKQHKGDVRASHMTMADDERIAIMYMVKEGRLSTTQAMEMVRRFEENKNLKRDDTYERQEHLRRYYDTWTHRHFYNAGPVYEPGYSGREYVPFDVQSLDGSAIQGDVDYRLAQPSRSRSLCSTPTFNHGSQQIGAEATTPVNNGHSSDTSPYGQYNRVPASSDVRASQSSPTGSVTSFSSAYSSPAGYGQAPVRFQHYQHRPSPQPRPQFCGQYSQECRRSLQSPGHSHYAPGHACSIHSNSPGANTCPAHPSRIYAPSHVLWRATQPDMTERSQTVPAFSSMERRTPVNIGSQYYDKRSQSLKSNMGTPNSNAAVLPGHHTICSMHGAHLLRSSISPLTQTSHSGSCIDQSPSTTSFDLMSSDSSASSESEPDSIKAPTASVQSILQLANLQNLIPIFLDNGFDDVDIFLDVNEKDLDQLGLFDPIVRKKLLDIIEKYKQDPVRKDGFLPELDNSADDSEICEILGTPVNVFSRNDEIKCTVCHNVNTQTGYNYCRQSSAFTLPFRLPGPSKDMGIQVMLPIDTSPNSSSDSGQSRRSVYVGEKGSQSVSASQNLPPSVTAYGNGVSLSNTPTSGRKKDTKATKKDSARNSASDQLANQLSDQLNMQDISPKELMSLMNKINKHLDVEKISLLNEPYTKQGGCCGIPLLLVQRYADELQHPVVQIAKAMERLRVCKLRELHMPFEENDKLSDQVGQGCEIAVTSLADMLTSIGLPMYIDVFVKGGYSTIDSLLLLENSQLKSLLNAPKKHSKRLIHALNWMRKRIKST